MERNAVVLNVFTTASGEGVRDLIGRIHIHLARAQASYTYFHNTALVHSEVKNNQTHIHTHSTVLRIFKVAQVIGIVLLVLFIFYRFCAN